MKKSRPDSEWTNGKARENLGVCAGLIARVCGGAGMVVGDDGFSGVDRLTEATKGTLAYWGLVLAWAVLGFYVVFGWLTAVLLWLVWIQRGVEGGPIRW